MYLSIFSYLLGIFLVLSSYWSWKKERHPDYYRLTVWWSILLAEKTVRYIYNYSGLRKASPLEVSTIISIIFSTITFTAGFYVLCILAKWMFWSERNQGVFASLMSKKGLPLVIVVSLILSTAIYGYMFISLR